MQMKVVVDTPEDYKKWLSEKTTLSQDIKAAAAAEKPAEGTESATDSTAKDTVKAVIDTVKAVVAKVAMK
jgi:cytochrome c oxidase subunit 2